MNNKINEFEMYLIKEERSKNTIDKYLRDVKRFFEWHGKDELVTKEDLLDYKDYLKTSNYKILTLNSIISSLNTYFKFIKNEGLKLRIIKYQKSLFGSKEKGLTANEYKSLYNACQDNIKLRLMIETIVKTGIRVSELKFITYESVKQGKAEIYNKGKTRTILIPRKLCIKLLDFCRGKHLMHRGECPRRRANAQQCRGEHLPEPAFNIVGAKLREPV